MGKILHSEQQLLRDWAVLVTQMFNGSMAYQVGSSMDDGKPHRDIDIRVIMESKKFKRLQASVNIERLSLAVSLWGQQVTGLPIDFQVQDRDYANEYHKGPRSAVGIDREPAVGDGYNPTPEAKD